MLLSRNLFVSQVPVSRVFAQIVTVSRLGMTILTQLFVYISNIADTISCGYVGNTKVLVKVGSSLKDL